VPALTAEDLAGHSSRELLTTLLQAGTPAGEAGCLAERLLATYGNLTGLVRAAKCLCGESGAGVPTTLLAALELGRRLLLEAVEAPARIQRPADIGPRLVVEMGGLEQERLCAVLLDTRHQVLALSLIYQGNINQVPVRAAELFREAVRHSASALIVVHNHPSGDPTPSPEDVAVTRTLVEAGRLLDIEVIDHLVIGSAGFVSLRERSLGFEARR
jgi:DNA repair protein RadC